MWLTLAVLQSQNISIDQINQMNEQRQREALEHQQQQRQLQQQGQQSSHVEPVSDTRARESSPRARKRKLEEEKAVEKIKKSKNFQRNKKGMDPRFDDDKVARDIYNMAQLSKAGQLENCAGCGKRFTVTTYTKAGPQGGLLCLKCAKELDDDMGTGKPKKKKAPATNYKRRQVRGDTLDGVVQRGARSLVDLCLRVSVCIVRARWGFSLVVQYLFVSLPSREIFPS